MSRTVMPPAYRDMIISSSPPSLLECLGTNLGVNEPSLSRGTSTVTSPTGVDSVSGATFTSRAVFNAVNAAAEQAGCDVAALFVDALEQAASA